MKGEETTGSAQTWRIGNLENRRPLHKSLTLFINFKSNYYGKTDYQKYKNNNSKNNGYGKTYGRLVHQDTM